MVKCSAASGFPVCKDGKVITSCPNAAKQSAAESSFAIWKSLLKRGDFVKVSKA